MFSVVPVDATGVPLRPMLSWLDQRSSAEAARISPSGRAGRRLRPVRCGADREGHRPQDRVAAGSRAGCRAADRLVSRLQGGRRRAADRERRDRPDRRQSRSVSSTRRPAPGTPSCAGRRASPLDRLPPIRGATEAVGALTREAADADRASAGTPVGVRRRRRAGRARSAPGRWRVGDVHLSLGTAVYFGILAETRLSDPGRRLGPLRHIAPARLAPVARDRDRRGGAVVARSPDRRSRWSHGA